MAVRRRKKRKSWEVKSVWLRDSILLKRAVKSSEPTEMKVMKKTLNFWKRPTGRFFSKPSNTYFSSVCF